MKLIRKRCSEHHSDQEPINHTNKNCDQHTDHCADDRTDSNGLCFLRCCIFPKQIQYQTQKWNKEPEHSPAETRRVFSITKPSSALCASAGDANDRFVHQLSATFGTIFHFVHSLDFSIFNHIVICGYCQRKTSS